MIHWKLMQRLCPQLLSYSSGWKSACWLLLSVCPTRLYRRKGVWWRSHTYWRDWPSNAQSRIYFQYVVIFRTSQRFNTWNTLGSVCSTTWPKYFSLAASEADCCFSTILLVGHPAKRLRQPLLRASILNLTLKCRDLLICRLAMCSVRRNCCLRKKAALSSLYSSGSLTAIHPWPGQR